jgi:flagellar basal body-associated protein FliL
MQRNREIIVVVVVVVVVAVVVVCVVALLFAEKRCRCRWMIGTYRVSCIVCDIADSKELGSQLAHSFALSTEKCV